MYPKIWEKTKSHRVFLGASIGTTRIIFGRGLATLLIFFSSLLEIKILVERKLIDRLNRRLWCHHAAHWKRELFSHVLPLPLVRGCCALLARGGRENLHAVQRRLAEGEDALARKLCNDLVAIEAGRPVAMGLLWKVIPRQGAIGTKRVHEVVYLPHPRCTQSRRS